MSAKKAKKKSSPDHNGTVTTNRRARFDFELIERFEAGMSLTGSEVKSLRSGNANLKDSYAIIEGGEALLVGAYIAPYPFARDGGHEPERPRKLLLHKREIDRIGGQAAEKGLTLIPVRIYFTRGKAKLELALAKGKTGVDKRETIKRREQQREMDRALRHLGRQ
ncbi:MAG: SsrA-binding protein SmpB [Acidimicrobiia bacterium]|nr:SsrA-binding protein SmpB [Acidimicrobiia bacterium]